MNELALFAGAGGGILAGHLLGWRTVCAVEWEPYAACVLAARQNDGVLPPFPIWDDVQTFDGRPWRGVVDVVSGGFPCQDISVAGKGAGIDGERSGMWKHMARIIGEVRPSFVFVENSPAIITRGLGRVLSDLAALGYDCKWTVLGAADVGAPHQRDRFWLAGEMAHATELQRDGSDDNAGLCLGGKSVSKFRNGNGAKNVADTKRTGLEGQLGQPRKQEISEFRNDGSLAYAENSGDVRGVGFVGSFAQKHDARRSQTDGGGEWWKAEPDVGRVADGVAARVDRLKAIGNGQVPAVAATAFTTLI